MKLHSLLILTALFLGSCKKDTPPQLPSGQYQINVKAEGVLNGIRAYIKGVDSRNRQVNLDTAMVVNGNFIFDGTIANPALHIITVDGIQNNLPFVLEEGVTYINLDKENIRNSVIDGPENNQGYQKFNTEFKRLSDEIRAIRGRINQARKDGNNELLNELLQKNATLTSAMRAYPHDFIDDNPNLNFSLLLLESQMAGQNQNLERFKSNIRALNGVISGSPQNQLLGQRISTFIALKEAQTKTDIGKVAPNFTSTTPDGQTLSLNDIKGKVTIIDFWASWCKPCRVENPNVVKVYEKYHDKGLEIIGVSLDREGHKERWLQAIKDDKLPWHQVGSLKYWNEPVAKMYNVSSIPATFILDENGVIVAKSLRGSALENKIAELLN